MIWLSFGRWPFRCGRYLVAERIYRQRYGWSGRYLEAERIYWRGYCWTPFVRLRLRRKGEEELPF